MPTRSAKFYSLFLILADYITLLLAFGLAYVIRVQLDPRPLVADVYARDFIWSFLAIAPLWIIVFASLGLYNATVYSRRMAEIGRLLMGTFIGILIVIGYAFVTDEPFFPARLVAIYALIGSFILLVFERELVRGVRGILFRFGIGISRVLIIGNSGATKDITEEMSDTRRSGYNIVALAGPEKYVPAGLGIKQYETMEKALRGLRSDRITTIIQTDLYDSSERNQKILSAAQSRHINYSFIPGEAEFYSGKNTVDIFLGYPIISVHQTPLIGWGEIAKRIFDVTISLLAAPVLIPVLLLIGLMQKIFNPGPVLYKSHRLSRYSKPFTLYKFRTMRPEFGSQDAEVEFAEMGRHDLAREYKKYRKVANDPRITVFGQILRKTSLDEFPQFINVLLGHLSLVGPRPILPQEIGLYRGRGALLHSVRSGLTGLWQVSGRSELSFDQRVDLELYYAQNWSFWLDIKIIFKTLRVLIGRSGAR